MSLFDKIKKLFKKEKNMKEYVNRWEKPLVNLALSGEKPSGDGGQMRYKVKLTKLKSNHNFLRTDIVVGYTTELPEVGSGFSMIAESLTLGFPMAGRLILTTEVQLVERIGKEFQFSTNNSSYKLEVLRSELDTTSKYNQ